jgi:hypothetical protein
MASPILEKFASDAYCVIIKRGLTVESLIFPAFGENLITLRNLSDT